MKALILHLILPVFIFGAPLLGLGQTRTISSTGDWHLASSWAGGNIANQVSHDVGFSVGGSKTITVRNGYSFTIGNFNIDNDNLIIEAGGELILGDQTNFENDIYKNLTGSNGAEITVYGTLIIWGNLVVNNNLEWTILGDVIIKGDIILNNNASLNLTGNGYLSVDGDFAAGTNTSISIDLDSEGKIEIGGDLTLGGGTTSIIGPNGSIIVGGTCTAPGTICQSAALPITLISFTAHQSGQAVEVNWVTGSEENTSHFVVERSSDGRSFQGIGTVQAQGWSSEPLSYQWVDACPLEGRAYYRLRAVDFDEHTDWFGMERVDLRGKSCAKLAVYPNPVVNHSVSVRLNAPVQEDSFVALKNNQGRTVYSAEARTGEQHYQLPANIPSGLYILEVHTRQERHSARVVIK
jgi:hypothetical protein